MKYQDCTFENAFWKQLLEIKDEWINCEMVGTISYSAFRKVNLSNIDSIIRNNSKWGSEYYHFAEDNKPVTNDHPHLLKIIHDVCTTLEFTQPTAAYYNYWMCSPMKMLQFIPWVIGKLIPTVLAHPLAMTDSRYHLAKTYSPKPTTLTAAQCLEKWGVPYYPHVPFVLERLNKAFFMSNDNEFLSRLFIIGGVDGGGSLKFTNDFKTTFPLSIHITNGRIFNKLAFNVNDILFIQHLLSDITPSMIVAAYMKYKCRIILNIHDFYYLGGLLNPHEAYLSKNLAITSSNRRLFEIAELVIHPSKFTYDIYAKHVSTDNFIISPHIDYVSLDSKLAIPDIHNKTINIGMISTYSECKGKEYISYLKKIVVYKKYSIKFLIIGENIPEYSENEVFDLCKKYNLHCLLALNKWGETYCYSLSKMMKMGLPILYNNIGAFRERIPDKVHFIKVFDHEVEFNKLDMKHLVSKFNEMLDLIIDNAASVESPPIDIVISTPELYKYICDPTYYSPHIWATIHSRVKPFCIYFPQFHAIKENDYNYYPGMTDMKNLIAYINSDNKYKLDSPSLSALEITSLEEYDQSSLKLVNKQVDIAKSAGIYGFCIYYYWFSNNTITQKNSIMEKCYDNFFRDELTDFKVFFNWANEDWTKNPAFVQSNSVDISNTYTENDIIANFNNLIKYFNHPNYYKIDNRPVFYIHQPWFMTDTEVERIVSIFNDSAIKSGFSGMHVVLNSMTKNYNTDTFLFAPNYKDPKYNADYTYLTAAQGNSVSTIFFSFNNSARMFKPAKKHVSVISNTTPINQKNALMAVMKNYESDRAELNKIMLINSWNEWGENMAIEPGLHKDNFYLSLLRSALIKFYR